MLSRLATPRQPVVADRYRQFPVKNAVNLVMPDCDLPMPMRPWLEARGVHVFEREELEATGLLYWCEYGHCEHTLLEPVIYCYIVNPGRWVLEPCYRVLVECHNEDCWVPF